MNIAKTSPVTGKVNTMRIDMSAMDYMEAYSAWKKGTYIQNAFPKLTADEREFIMTGTMPGEYDAMFPEGDE